MNRQIRRLGIGLLVLYIALFVQLNLVQVLRAEDYTDNALNNREITRDFTRARGRIVSADGVVLARSEEVGGPLSRQRVYPEGELFGQVTGFFSFTVGADGVERTYNDELAGRGRPVSVDNLVDLFLDDEPQADVTLTLPAAVQRVARDQLGARRGSVVAIDPRTGALLALWSFPSYDPTPLSSADQALAERTRELLLASPDRPLLPRSFRETFFPGSTFKVVTAAAALAEGRRAEDLTFPVESAYVPPLTSRPIRNFGGSTCGGNLFSALQVSCNTAFARLGVDLGADTLVPRAEAFGFNREPPLDLPTVATSVIGDVASFEENTPVLAQTALGQNAVAATPLQMALVAAGIANGGTVMAPHVMAEVRDEDGEVIDTFEPTPWTEAVAPEVAATVRDAMVGVVEDGTARQLAVPGVPTAGKTGTAQLGTDPPASHAWVIGFAPADQPRVAVAVIVEGQPGASEQTGGRVAAPIGRAVLEAALAATS